MQQKTFTLINKGMNRDLSPSKVGQSCVYENKNIRIIAQDHDTLLSVSNERGNKQACSVTGLILGATVLNEYLIVFTKSNASASGDSIYRIKFNPNTAGTISGANITNIYTGNLGFSSTNPIEAIAYYESEDIQKVYWVDGKNVLRCANIMQTYSYSGSGVDDIFDVNKSINFIDGVDIELTSAGNARPNGVTQYFITYYNLHGQESGIAWVSDLVYLSPEGIGGRADGVNSCCVKITIPANQLDTSFTNFRVYSIFRSSLDGEVASFLVAEDKTSDNSITITDDGAHLVAEDTQRLLYLGSLPVIAETISHKDGALFLGNLKSVGKESYDAIENYIRTSGALVGFTYASNNAEADQIEYSDGSQLYPYNNQLYNTSFGILSFKANEKYRFAIRLQYADGTMTDAFWLYDAETGNTYPKVAATSSSGIDRIVAEVTLPSSLMGWLYNKGFRSVQVMIAEPTDADRSVKAQGIVNPTMFSVWERYNNRVYSVPSWISRPINSEYTYSHCGVVGNSTTSLGEIQCNYWEDDKFMTPGNESGESYDSAVDYTHIMAVYYISRPSGTYDYRFTVYVYTAKVETGHASDLMSVDVEAAFSTSDASYHEDSNGFYYEYTDPNGYFSIRKRYVWGDGTGTPSKSRPQAYAMLESKLADLGYDEACIDYNSLKYICENTIDPAGATKQRYFNLYYYEDQGTLSGTMFSTLSAAVNAGNKASSRWETAEDTQGMTPGRYAAAYYRKNLMYVDANVITLDSPEIHYGASVVDNAEYSFRLVGIAQCSSVISDYTVNSTTGRLSGSNLDTQSFSKIYSVGRTLNGIISWPLWRDYGLVPKENNLDPKTATNDDYSRAGTIVHYWMYMWQRAGSIDGWKDAKEESQFGVLDAKTFANERCAYKTIYFQQPISVDITGTRVVDGDSTNQVILNVGSDEVVYSAKPRIQLTMPGGYKYPVLYSQSLPASTDETTGSDSAYLYASDPVTIEYSSSRHAVLTLPVSTSGSYSQTVLPVLAAQASSVTTTYDQAAWLDSSRWPFSWTQQSVVARSNVTNAVLTSSQPYLFIGEIYRLFGSGDSDTRYGGISAEARRNCRYIAASNWSKITGSTGVTITAYGDTYVQRWDALRIKPYSNDSVNNVIEIASAVLETHINIDGRTDKQRGISEVASIDTVQYNTINPVYSQKNNFFVARDLGSYLNTDSYSNAITWTLQKQDTAVTDEWMHITLANSMFLDGDRGECTALRRFGNSLIAFQPEGIAEVMYNSRTQLSTNVGVPVEIANSGKVEGKSYISRLYGCKNKRTISEGKRGLYFIDDYNKAFCAISGRSIDNISSRLGFGVYMARNFVPSTGVSTAYDKRYDDVYIIPGSNLEDALAYNEKLDSFVSFYSYGGAYNMLNCLKHFLSTYRHPSSNETSIWYQNEGLYCNFYGGQFDYSVTYRVSPPPFTDKIWSSIDVKADFYSGQNSSASNILEEELIDGGYAGQSHTGNYLPEEHFTSMNIWNEYQKATIDEETDNNPIKKFRVWRYQVPRADITDTNIYGDDRIRNPWVFIKFTKEVIDNANQYLMQLHDVEVKYFE